MSGKPGPVADRMKPSILKACPGIVAIKLAREIRKQLAPGIYRINDAQYEEIIRICTEVLGGRKTKADGDEERRKQRAQAAKERGTADPHR